MRISLTKNDLLHVIHSLRAYLFILEADALLSQIGFDLNIIGRTPTMEEFVEKVNNAKVNTGPQVKELLSRLQGIYNKDYGKR